MNSENRHVCSLPDSRVNIRVRIFAHGNAGSRAGRGSSRFLPEAGPLVPGPAFFWLDLTSGIAGASLGMARDCWVENLRCPHCGKTGEARLSAADAYSWDVQVDRAPEGFKLMRSNFYCAACDIPAEL